MPGTLSLGAMVRLLRSTTGMLSLRPAIRHPSMVHVRLRATIHVRHGAVMGAAGDGASVHVRHSAVMGAAGDGAAIHVRHAAVVGAAGDGATIHVRHSAVVGAAGNGATIHVRHSAVVGVSRGARHGLPRVSVMRTRPLSKSKRASKDCYDDGYGLVHMR